jgi:hypothetical protein
MSTIGATAMSGFARKTAETVTDFATVVRNLITDVRDSYRPERHYLRGPGQSGALSIGLCQNSILKLDYRPSSTSWRRSMFAVVTRLTR